MKHRFVFLLMFAALALPHLAHAQQVRLSISDQRRFDSYYSRWQSYKATNNQGEVRSMEGRMQDVYQHYGIPANTPYSRVASGGGGVWQGGGWNGMPAPSSGPYAGRDDYRYHDRDDYWRHREWEREHERYGDRDWDRYSQEHQRWHREHDRDDDRDRDEARHDRGLHRGWYKGRGNPHRDRDGDHDGDRGDHDHDHQR